MKNALKDKNNRRFFVGSHNSDAPLPCRLATALFNVKQAEQVIKGTSQTELLLKKVRFETQLGLLSATASKAEQSVNLPASHPAESVITHLTTQHKFGKSTSSEGVGIWVTKPSLLSRIAAAANWVVQKAGQLFSATPRQDAIA